MFKAPTDGFKKRMASGQTLCHILDLFQSVLDMGPPEEKTHLMPLVATSWASYAKVLADVMCAKYIFHHFKVFFIYFFFF